MITAAAQNPCGSRAKDLDVSQAVADFRFGRRGSAHDLFQNVDDADRPMEDRPSVAFPLYRVCRAPRPSSGHV